MRTLAKGFALSFPIAGCVAWVFRGYSLGLYALMILAAQIVVIVVMLRVENREEEERRAKKMRRSARRVGDDCVRPTWL